MMAFVRTAAALSQAASKPLFAPAINEKEPFSMNRKFFNTLWKDWNRYYMPECLAKARAKLLEQPTCEHVRNSFTISEE
jgi:hypothetical protein